MKKVLMFFIVAVMLLSASLAVWAGEITISNSTGCEICEIYISDCGTNDWEEEVLKHDTLVNGETLCLTVNDTYMQFDLRAVDGSGNSLNWYALPGIAHIVAIHGDGTAEYR
ncbi:MAG: hypothetical protein FWF87_01300 [Synergistaceae bacterium]|nr:hypothetical protein [Synergistaceae bacterium]